MKNLSYNEKQKRLQAAKQRKEKAIANLIVVLDAEIKLAVKSDAYHVGELDQLNRARSSLFAVRAGYVSRNRR